MKFNTSGIAATLLRLYRSVWLFPLICTVVLLLLTAFKLSGSSIGVYNSILYGAGHKDKNLVLNVPRPIRSDEWVWNTQMIIAQANSGYKRINPNLGHGMDMSLVIDVPYKDWSAVFRPQNIVFFILPFEYAFAFKWWLLSYLLLLSCYFFVLYLLPKKRLLAAAISLALLASPFIQWWYQYITLAPIYYCLFSLLAFMHFLKCESTKVKLLLVGLIAYLLICLILVLYPPFQIACAYATAAFAVGYMINHFRKSPRSIIFKNLGMLIAAVAIAGAFTLFFIHTRSSAVNSVQNTAYPGKRVVASGSYNFFHLFSGNLDFQLQFTSKATAYQIPKQGITNQSEDSSFILLLPFLLLPSIFMIYKNFKDRKALQWPLLLLVLVFIGFTAWLFIPGLDLISKVTLLSKVPENRLIIGFGLLNVLVLVSSIKSLWEFKKNIFPEKVAILYSILVFVFELGLALHIKQAFPGYIGIYRTIAFSLPLPIIVWLLLTRRFELAIVGFAAFSIFSTIGVNPIYKGTDIITQSPVSTAIKNIASTQKNANWAVEYAPFENIAFLNGAHSITGVYSYPQLDIWNKIHGADPYVYNRYAHVNFTFYRDAAENLPTKIELSDGDHLGIDTEPCSSFMLQNNVHFIVTNVALSTSDTCANLLQTVHYPATPILIYRVN